MSSSKGPSRSASSHSAFSAVDDLVSKPIVGSDGAASWQNFRNDKNYKTSSLSKKGPAAPRAPLKKSDRLGTGFSSWKDEQAHEAKVRQQSGHTSLHSGYTNFKKDGDDERQNAAQRKKAKLVEARERPEDKEYFIEASTFEGWKFDYVFTTRKNWGTGYFWDGTDSVKKLHGIALPQAPKQSATTTDDAIASKSAGKSKKKKKRKRAGPVIVEDPKNPRAQIAAAYERRNQALGGPQHDPTLPAGWEAASDPTTRKTYYYNRETGERAWEKPEMAALPEGWSESKDPNTNKTYYYHASGKTSWDRPTK